MPVRVVESRDNARLKALRRALAAPGSGTTGLVAVEGPHLIDEALRAGVSLKTVFVAGSGKRILDGLIIPPETEILCLPAPLLAAALTTETPQPMAALVEPPNWNWTHILASGPKAAALLVVLSGLQDPGNLGAILRSAEAFGATGVVSLPGTVSAWNPKVVRASAGSVFRVPLVAAGERECVDKLHQAGVRILATSVRLAQPAEQVNLAEPVALIIGNEGKGVPAQLAARSDAAVTIPCPGPVESLNAAVAASILLYEASRQRTGSDRRPATRPGARR